MPTSPLSRPALPRWSAHGRRMQARRYVIAAYGLSAPAAWAAGHRRSRPARGRQVTLSVVPAAMPVQKSLGHMLPYIPKYKSTGDSTPLADVLADGTAACSRYGETVS